MFAEKHTIDYTRADIRFTRKGDTLYAGILGDGGSRVVITSIGSDRVEGKVERVSLLASAETLPHQQTAEGLEVTLPAARAGAVPVLRIEGLKNLSKGTVE